MQNLENDIDELFRKAVKNYSLKSSESEWDELSNRLSYKSISLYRVRKYFTFKKKLSVLFCVLGILAAVSVPIDTLDSYKLHHAAILLNGAKIKNFKRTVTEMHDSQFNELLNRRTCSPLPELAILYASPQFVIDMIASGNQNDESHEKHLAKEIFQINRGNEILPALIETAAVKVRPIELSNQLHPDQHSSLVKLDRVQGRGFYYGVVLGPLWSQVRHYEFTKAGFDFGIIVGYKFNRKTSIEIGLLRTKEYYYLGQKNPYGINGLTGIGNLKGSREALQIPFNFNYQIMQRKSTRLFISAGFASFVEVDEKPIINDSSNSPPSSQRSDHGFASNLPSYLTVGIGAEFRIGKLANIRLEPYSQIPLQSAIGNSISLGITRQSLQFFNAGLRIGITRFIR